MGIKTGILDIVGRAVPIYRPRKGWWTGSPNYGDVVTWPRDGTDLRTILKLDEDGPPRQWTVSLALENPTSNDLIFSSFNITCRCSFGSGGADQIVELDWINGTTFTVTANAINVQALYGNQAFLGNGGDSTLRLSVLVGEYSSSSGLRPRITILERFSVLNTENSTLERIPAFVGRLKAIPTDSSEAAIAAFYDTGIRIVTIGGAAIATGLNTGAMRFSDLLTQPGLDVVGGAKYVHIANDSGATAVGTLYGELFL